jgi:hypothetical protein
VTKKKVKVHKLLPRHVRQRKNTARKLYEKYMSGTKSEYVVTLDEAWFYLNDCKGKNNICYIREEEKKLTNWVLEKEENEIKKIMAVAGITRRGVLPLHRVPSNTKINAEYYINCVLKPRLEMGLPKLYGNELHKVIIHHDQAPSHVSKKTMEYAADLKSRLG